MQRRGEVVSRGLCGPRGGQCLEVAVGLRVGRDFEAKVVERRQGQNT
jgi:hypothetical protein